MARGLLTAGALVLASISSMANARDPAAGPADPVVKDEAQFDAMRPMAQELQASVPDGFVIASVGDMIISRPLSQYAARMPAFRAVLERLKKSDVAFGNLETTIFDPRSFKGSPYSWEGDWTNSSLPAVAQRPACHGLRDRLPCEQPCHGLGNRRHAGNQPVARRSRHHPCRRRGNSRACAGAAVSGEQLGTHRARLACIHLQADVRIAARLGRIARPCGHQRTASDLGGQPAACGNQVARRSPMQCLRQALRRNAGHAAAFRHGIQAGRRLFLRT